MNVPETSLDLVIAAALGACVGLQRQYTQKPAGIRTHALVSLGACAFAGYSSLLSDTRIAAGVITGIGFLGAGAIVRQGLTTRGLTTAASIWTASAIGMAMGLGHLAWFPISLALTVLTVALLTISDDFILRVLPRTVTIAIRVDADLGRVAVDHITDELRRLVKRARCNQAVSIVRVGEGRRASIGYVVDLDAHKQLTPVLEALSVIDGVLHVAVDEPLTPAM